LAAQEAAAWLDSLAVERYEEQIGPRSSEPRSSIEMMGSTTIAGLLARAAALVAGLGAAPPAWSAKPAELFWAEPFVVRRGQTVTLTVEGRRLPLAADAVVL